MKRLLARSAAALMAFASANSFAETLTQYVQTCKTELAFQALPALNCFDGIRFATRDPNNLVNDWVVHARVNESVDMVAACRWLEPIHPPPPEERRAFSLEMLVHNRDNGKTCFFRAREDLPVPPGQQIGQNIPPQMLSPTASNAGDYWKQPQELNGNGGVARCAGCHVGGPYVISARIAPSMAKLGLLNDGHDTFVDGTNPAKKYRIVNAGVAGSAFEGWESLRSSFEVKTGCNGACHAIGSKSNFKDLTGFGLELIPSIKTDIARMLASGLMPPDHDENVFRWINRDNPFKSGDAGDSEKFAHAKAEFPRLHKDCGTPGGIEAFAVNSDGAHDFVFRRPSGFPDRLAVFNLRDGLKCNGADQPDGKCADYKTSYLCPNGWVGTNHPVTGGNDDESRSRQTGICANPAAIMAETAIDKWSTMIEYGPRDRLAKFDPEGLECRNADQGAGQRCSNYVVRFSQCSTTPERYGIVSSWSGRELTASANSNDAETRAQPATPGWSSQEWVVEYIQPTTAVQNLGIARASSFVRLRNTWTGRYLNAQNQGDGARVTTHDLREDWTSMWWLAEAVAGTNDLRFRNVWSGRYLTVVDNGDFSQVVCRTLNATSSSQRWSLHR